MRTTYILSIIVYASAEEFLLFPDAIFNGRYGGVVLVQAGSSELLNRWVHGMNGGV
jgi:hypothetical protein